MNYLAYGQRSFKFLITPNELKELLQKYHLVVNNARVSKDYTETEIADYLQSYAALYDTLAFGSQIQWQRDYTYFQSTGITSDISKCKYEKHRSASSDRYLIPAFLEPVPTISPMVLVVRFDSEGKIHCSTSGSEAQFPECFFGLSLTYPTKIQFRSCDDYEAPRETVGLSGYKDYLEITQAIKSITSSLRLKYNLGTAVPNIRISKAAKEQIQNCWLLSSHNLEI